MPKESIKKEIKKRNKSSARTTGARRRNDYSDAFCTVYADLHPDELKYKPLTKDYVQLADLRKTAEQDAPGWLDLAHWQRAVNNYFASGIATPTLADLAVRFRTFYKSPLDKYGKAIEQPSTVAIPQGCELCLSDPMRLKLGQSPGWRFDATSKSFIPCVCTTLKGNGNGQLQGQGQQAARY